MDKQTLMDSLALKFKLVRVEQRYTQDEMSSILGISKKTLVQIEKGRISPGWTTTVALCSLFQDSEILCSYFGDDPLVMVKTAVHTKPLTLSEHSIDGKVWWTPVEQLGIFTLEQNMISKHFRIIDDQLLRRFSTFDKEEGIAVLKEIFEQHGKSDM